MAYYLHTTNRRFARIPLYLSRRSLVKKLEEIQTTAKQTTKSKIKQAPKKPA